TGVSDGGERAGGTNGSALRKDLQEKIENEAVDEREEEEPEKQKAEEEQLKFPALSLPDPPPDLLVTQYSPPAPSLLKLSPPKSPEKVLSPLPATPPPKPPYLLLFQSRPPPPPPQPLLKSLERVPAPFPSLAPPPKPPDQSFIAQSLTPVPPPPQKPPDIISAPLPIQSPVPPLTPPFTNSVHRPPAKPPFTWMLVESHPFVKMTHLHKFCYYRPRRGAFVVAETCSTVVRPVVRLMELVLDSDGPIAFDSRSGVSI
ncbi:hypothetical protein A2U01_0003222, partial [Trifolium medium]|nr:hypothetical protein [Trifolium medium]